MSTDGTLAAADEQSAPQPTNDADAEPSPPGQNLVGGVSDGAAATIVQARLRGNADRKVHANERSAAVAMQSTIRGRATRRDLQGIQIPSQEERALAEEFEAEEVARTSQRAANLAKSNSRVNSPVFVRIASESGLARVHVSQRPPSDTPAKASGGEDTWTPPWKKVKAEGVNVTILPDGPGGTARVHICESPSASPASLNRSASSICFVPSRAYHKLYSW